MTTHSLSNIANLGFSDTLSFYFVLFCSIFLHLLRRAHPKKISHRPPIRKAIQLRGTRNASSQNPSAGSSSNGSHGGRGMPPAQRQLGDEEAHPGRAVGRREARLQHRHGHKAPRAQQPLGLSLRVRLRLPRHHWRDHAPSQLLPTPTMGPGQLALRHHLEHHAWRSRESTGLDHRLGFPLQLHHLHWSPLYVFFHPSLFLFYPPLCGTWTKSLILEKLTSEPRRAGCRITGSSYEGWNFELQLMRTGSPSSATSVCPGKEVLKGKQGGYFRTISFLLASNLHHLSSEFPSR